MTLETGLEPGALSAQLNEKSINQQSGEDVNEVACFNCPQR